MSRLFDTAIEKVRSLPDDVQDEAAQVLFMIASRRDGPIPLDSETKAAILEGLAQMQRGEFARPEDVEKLLRPKSE